MTGSGRSMEQEAAGHGRLRGAGNEAESGRAVARCTMPIRSAVPIGLSNHLFA
jgi:hypothetical protein